jgi:hypothetical protein
VNGLAPAAVYWWRDGRSAGIVPFLPVHHLVAGGYGGGVEIAVVVEVGLLVGWGWPAGGGGGGVVVVFAGAEGSPPSRVTSGWARYYWVLLAGLAVLGSGVVGGGTQAFGP